ncbi:SDR family oxidoreductase [Actinomadura rubrisoli]|uniref:NAD-dependent epimerase/dehydratase family protein n=1 Tax=Actinomadura rubrisoli TaxID=2530368 RepID=A0A4R5C3J3_9ACTN|nr:SDR family oxidoreductase [Actinomadura rubrisoli]TDD94251.1 NAD-dependent epimerase/dehydratase family protein [Actinomadura rubrisoli]
MTVHLVTGATGFVGGALVLELLDRTDDEVIALVRGRDQAEAAARLRTALPAMARGYARTDLAEPIASRVAAVCGDITEPGCGVDTARAPRATQVWHTAASLRYEERHRSEIERHNVDGTRHVLDLARGARAEVFNQISTAYVTGARTGLMLEAPVTDLTRANNCYEETKILGERMVAAAGRDMRVRILRPGVVIGHSRTGHGLNWSGMYGFLRSLQLLREAGRRRFGVDPDGLRLRFRAERDIEINLVPIDHVARLAVSIATSDSPGTYFHLTNATAPTVGETLTAVTALLGFGDPIWSTDTSRFTPLELAIDSEVGFYRAYLNHGKRFDLTNTRAVDARADRGVPLPRHELTRYLRYYLTARRNQPGASWRLPLAG